MRCEETRNKLFFESFLSNEKNLALIQFIKGKKQTRIFTGLTNEPVIRAFISPCRKTAYMATVTLRNGEINVPPLKKLLV